LFDDDDYVVELLTLQKRVHVPQENGQMIRSIPRWNDDSHYMLRLTLDWFVPSTDFYS
jgi:hypothetical protein